MDPFDMMVEDSPFWELFSTFFTLVLPQSQMNRFDVFVKFSFFIEFFPTFIAFELLHVEVDTSDMPVKVCFRWELFFTRLTLEVLYLEVDFLDVTFEFSLACESPVTFSTPLNLLTMDFSLVYPKDLPPGQSLQTDLALKACFFHSCAVVVGISSQCLKKVSQTNIHINLSSHTCVKLRVQKVQLNIVSSRHRGYSWSWRPKLMPDSDSAAQITSNKDQCFLGSPRWPPS